MADVTVQVDLTTDWKNITAALALAAEANYIFDVARSESSALVQWCITDAVAVPSATLVGHPIKPTDRGALVDTREAKQVTGEHLWMRVDRGAAIVVVTKE